MRKIAISPHVNSTNIISNNHKVTQRLNHFYEHSSLSMTSIDGRSSRNLASPSGLNVTALGDRSESFERALENNVLNGHARNTPVNSSFQQPLPINTYDEIDNLKVKTKGQ